jgi:hypothetical protein
MARLALDLRLPMMPAVGKRDKPRQLVNAKPRNGFPGGVILGKLGDSGTFFFDGHMTAHAKGGFREARFSGCRHRRVAIRALERGGGNVRAMAEG